MIKVLIDGVEFTYNAFTFSGGEVHTRFLHHPTVQSNCIIKACINSSSELMTLLLIKDALDQYPCIQTFTLEIPYIPYGRQDRRCAVGEAFGLKIIGNLINSMKFDKVITFDPHSYVTAAVIDRLVVRNLSDIVGSHLRLQKLAFSTTAISPDAGASKKVFELVLRSKSGKFIQAEKIRDTNDGRIVATKVNCDDLAGQEVTIWDDICDGGRTFIELAKVLKEKGADKINLYVTHGIFSKGYEPLFESGIDHIYTTDSLRSCGFNKNVTIIKECF